MTNPIKYVCHCNNCGDEFWIDKAKAANEVQCPTCKKMTPLVVKGTACEVTDDNKWVVDIKGCPYEHFEISVLRNNNEHGKQSYGWIDDKKLLISSETTASWSVIPLVFEKLTRVAEEVAEELNIPEQCPTCKEPMPCSAITGREPTCTCDEFKNALEMGSGDDMYFPAISVDEGKYQIGCVPINFCPWCGMNVPERKEHNE